MNMHRQSIWRCLPCCDSELTMPSNQEIKEGMRMYYNPLKYVLSPIRPIITYVWIHLELMLETVSL